LVDLEPQTVSSRELPSWQAQPPAQQSHEGACPSSVKNTPVCVAVNMRPRTFGGLVLTVIETHTIMDDQFVRTDDPLHHFDCLFAREQPALKISG
jgi:hypothetical protein